MDEHIDRQDGATADAIGGLVSGDMGREDFVKRMGLLGFSATAIGGMLAAAGKADASAGRAFAGKKINKRHNLTGPQGVRGRNSDNTRLREVLKWEPQVSLEEGLSRTYRWIEGELQKSSLPATAAV